MIPNYKLLHELELTWSFYIVVDLHYKDSVRNVIKIHLKHDNYKHISETGERMNSSMKMIRSFDHDIYTVNITKVSLSAYDDKRYIQEDGVTSYAYGQCPYA